MIESRTLPAVVVAIAEQRSLDAVLGAITSSVVSQPDVALARVWLLDGDALYLRASAGRPLDPTADWGRIDGDFRRIPLSSPLKIGRIARSGEPVRVDRLGGDAHWVQSPEWARRERLESFAGRPLTFRGEVLGVLGVFRRAGLDDEWWAWLRAFSDAAAIAVANARALEQAESLRRALELERDYLREEVRDSGAFGEILGHSPALTRVLQEVDTVATTDSNVLILGESGTGKELVARAIHQRSRRAAKPLVKVNCGSIPRELFESEFFGHVRGSFTGAVRDRVGRFRLANGGTLFLDEAGEIPLDLQAKLLRVLQEGKFERVGDDATQHVDVQGHRRDEPRAVEGGGRGAVQARSLLPARCVPDRAASPARPPWGHPGSRRPLRAPVLRADARADAARADSRAGTGGRLRLAGKHPRAAERRRTGGDPRPRRRDRAAAAGATVRAAAFRGR